MYTTDLNEEELNPYYNLYIDKLSKEVPLRQLISQCGDKTRHFFSTISHDKLEYRYAPDKWTIKEVLQHLIDTERIFSYRAFRIARRDMTPLANFDQNIYMNPSYANQKSISQLAEEYDTTRNATISLLNSLSDEDLSQVGISSGVSMSARAAAFTIAGHDIWHIDIIKERYL